MKGQKENFEAKQRGGTGPSQKCIPNKAAHITLLLNEQSDQGLHSVPFHPHHLERLKSHFVQTIILLKQYFGCPKIKDFDSM